MHLLQVAIGVHWHNNDKLFIMYCNWLSLPDTCMYVRHPMLHRPDWTSDFSTDWLYPPEIYIDHDRHMIEYLTWHILYCVLSTLLFIYFIHAISYSRIYIFFIYSHVMCTCTFQFILTTFTRSSDSLDLHIQILAIYCWSDLWRGSGAS